MGLGLFGLLFLSIMILSTVALVVLLFNKGQLVQREWLFMLVQFYLVLLAGMMITTGPNSDVPSQYAGYGIFALAIVPLFLKKHHFTLARMMLGALVIVAPICIFFF